MLENVAEVVQAEVDRLTRQRVDKIIFASHLQDGREDRAVIAQLRNVDVAIAGGGDELRANADDSLVPGDVRAIDPDTGQPFTYPTFTPDADGNEVPIVTTAGDYKYVGRLVVDFDRKGRVVDVDEDLSGPVRVSGVAPDAVVADPALQQQVVEPVSAFIAELAQNVLAQSEVPLEGRRNPGIRTQETNLGNLHTDGVLRAAQVRAADFGVDAPQIAVQNGGGIRNNSLIPAGPITELNTFDIAAFANFVSVIEDVRGQQSRQRSRMRSPGGLERTGGSRRLRASATRTAWRARRR